jgi:hypothetical protein
MGDEVSIKRGHVTLTIVSFISMVIFLMVTIGAGVFKIAEYKGRIVVLEDKIEEIKTDVTKLDDLELSTTLKSIDRRLGNIEKSSALRASRAYEEWKAKD